MMKKEKGTVFVLPVNNELVSVNKKVYAEFYKLKNHEDYLKHKDKINDLVSYDSWDMDTRIGMDFLVDKNVNVEEEVIKKIAIEKLLKCLKILNKDELNLIHKIYIENRTEKETANILKITQQSVNNRKKSLLKKLYLMLKDIY